MTPSAPTDGPPDPTSPVVALLDCGPAEAAAQVAALVDLAGRLGTAVRTDMVSASCTTLCVQLAPEGVRRFQSALLLGGATFLAVNHGQETHVTVIVTASARPARSE